jgi:hypothetical protein
MRGLRGKGRERQQAKGEPATTKQDHRMMAGGDERGREDAGYAVHGENVRTQRTAL